MESKCFQRNNPTKRPHQNGTDWGKRDMESVGSPIPIHPIAKLESVREQTHDIGV